MSAELALVVGAIVGMAAGALLIPATRRELASAVARADGDAEVASPALLNWQRTALILASGVVPAYVLSRTGWSIEAIPTLLMFLGLVQLGYCDAQRRLLPKTMVYATTLCVAASALAVAAATGQWHRLAVALVGCALFSTLFLAINLMNPAWMAFGDVRLAPVVGLGLAWFKPMALLDAFLLANILVALVGIVVIVAGKGSRKDALPFGLYLAMASGVVILAWS